MIEDLEIKLASKTKRFLALLIDYVWWILFFVFMGVNFGEKFVTENGAKGFHMKGWPAFLIMLFWFVTIPFAEAFAGQSLGKFIFKIKVLNKNGCKASFGNTLVRHLFDFVDYLPGFGIVGIIVASKNQLQQRVGDMVANTIVVEK